MSILKRMSATCPVLNFDFGSRAGAMLSPIALSIWTYSSCGPVRSSVSTARTALMKKFSDESRCMATCLLMLSQCQEEVFSVQVSRAVQPQCKDKRMEMVCQMMSEHLHATE